MTSIGSAIVDTYILFRIFRDFDIKEIEKDQPILPTNIIIYTGDTHAYI